MEVQRIYVDSRDRVSGDASEFAFRLGIDINIPKASVAVLDTVAIPVSWYTVERGVNDRIYMSETRQGDPKARFYALIEPGYYYNKPAMAAAMLLCLPLLFLSGPAALQLSSPSCRSLLAHCPGDWSRHWSMSLAWAKPFLG